MPYNSNSDRKDHSKGRGTYIIVREVGKILRKLGPVITTYINIIIRATGK